MFEPSTLLSVPSVVLNGCSDTELVFDNPSSSLIFTDVTGSISDRKIDVAIESFAEDQEGVHILYIRDLVTVLGPR